MRRLKALGKRTKHNYERVLARAFGGREPSFVPDLSRGGRNDGPWPEPSRATLRAAITWHWEAHGQKERGEALSKQILPGKVHERARKVPLEADVQRFENNVYVYRDERARLLTLLMLGLGLRVEEMLVLRHEDLKQALKTGFLTLTITKGMRERTLPIAKVRGVLAVLLEQPARQPHSLEDRTTKERRWEVLGELLARRGSAFSTQYNLFGRHLRAMAASLPKYQWSSHLLRHIFSRRLRKAGAPLSLIKLALGHAGTDGTSRVYLEDKGMPVTPAALLPWLRSYKP